MLQVPVLVPELVPVLVPELEQELELELVLVLVLVLELVLVLGDTDWAKLVCNLVQKAQPKSEATGSSGCW